MLDFHRPKELCVSKHTKPLPRMPHGTHADAVCSHAVLPIPVCALVAWLRSCTLLYTKPRLVLVMGGRDPVIVRRLGQPEDESVVVNLGLNYHLDSYLDEDMKRFAVEFPQCFQVGGGPLSGGGFDCRRGVRLRCDSHNMLRTYNNAIRITQGRDADDCSSYAHAVTAQVMPSEALGQSLLGEGPLVFSLNLHQQHTCCN